MKHLTLLGALVLISACGERTAATEEGATTADTAATSSAPAIDLAAHGLPLLLNAPDQQTTGGAEPSIVWKDETGTLEVRVGDHFGLMIREEPGDIARVKAALDRDLLRKNTLLRETPELITYRSEFPDDPTLVFLHFYQVVAAGDRTFIIQDVEGQPFNQQDIDRMLVAISPKQPA